MADPIVNMWENWAKNVAVHPRSMARPGSLDETRRIVRDAAQRGESVRAVGAGHSFAPVCDTAGTLLDLSLLTGLESIDPASGDATLLAGTPVHTIGPLLSSADRALANQGDIDRQAIAGAIATGTHGTGRAAGSFSAQITALELISPEGDLLTLDVGDVNRFPAARLALGMLGIISRVTLATVPAFRLRERTRALPFEACVATFAETEPVIRHAEFWWLPRFDTCVLKTLEETTAAPLRSTAQEYPPGTIERYLKPEAIDWSWRIYPSQRTVPFVELEYTMPLAHGPSAMLALRDMMRQRHPDCSWAVEYRTQPGETALLSPTQGQDSVTISVHQAGDLPWEPLFRDAEALFLAHDGRPHWGKLHFLDGAAIAERFPMQPAVERVREELDPRGMFLNDYLRRLGFGG